MLEPARLRCTHPIIACHCNRLWKPNMLNYVKYIETDTWELHLTNNLVHCCQHRSHTAQNPRVALFVINTTGRSLDCSRPATGAVV
jgi:hypothetical protein